MIITEQQKKNSLMFNFLFKISCPFKPCIYEKPNNTATTLRYFIFYLLFVWFCINSHSTLFVCVVLELTREWSIVYSCRCRHFSYCLLSTILSFEMFVKYLQGSLLMSNRVHVTAYNTLFFFFFFSIQTERQGV